MSLDFEEMRRIYRLEKNTARLVEVPTDFFTQLHGLIEEERKKYFDSLKDLNTTRARDFGNLKKLVDEWFVVREKKILNTVLVAAQMGEKDLTHLSSEEKKLFAQLFDTLCSHRRTTQSVLDANGEFVPIIVNEVLHASSPSSPASSSSPAHAGTSSESTTAFTSSAPSHSPSSTAATATSSSSSSTAASSSSGWMSVRILSEIPSFVGTDLREYGPYKEGDVVSLPGKIAQLFISRKLGESSA
ncbi:MAG: hypothetical protein AABY11_02540 [archaeon]